MASRIGLFKEPVSALTHFAGFVAALAGLGFLLFSSRENGPKQAAVAIYGVSLAVLFLSSSVYHFLDLGERGNRWLRRLDHGAIFLLIAGTYVPALTLLLGGTWRVVMLSVVATLAVLGLAFKLAWVDCPGWISTSLYLAMGWLIVIPGYRMLPRLSAWPLSWLVLGGMAYTVGALVYLFEWPDPWPRKMGHHEIWHLFVLAGAFAHFVFVASLLDLPLPPFG